MLRFPHVNGFRRNPELPGSYFGAGAVRAVEYLARLPDGALRGIEESLNLNNTKIKSLPPGLKVGGNLDLSHSDITSLPSGLDVKGHLNLQYTKIKELPSDLKVSTYLFLGHSEITELPRNFEIEGYLDLRNTKIKSLPAGLRVGGGLYLNELISGLPPDLEVGFGPMGGRVHR